MTSASSPSVAPSRLDGIVVVPWHQLIDAVLRPVVDELGECVGQPGMRFHVVEFAGLDERGDDGPVGTAFVGAGEERILRFRAIGRIDRSTVLVSISMRPSTR